MWQFFALLITGAVALPTPEPGMVAILPPGSNMSVTWNEGSRPPVILAGGNKMVQGTPTPVLLGREHLFRRVEFNFLDFQFNQTAPLATNLIQNLEIYVNVTLGPYRGMVRTENITEPGSGTFTSPFPESTEGFTQIFTGVYNGATTDNKVNIDRKITRDMCGIIFNKGFIEVWVRPVDGEKAGLFTQGFYTCFFNLDIENTIVQQSEARWNTMPMQCNSGNLNNYSHRLWFQTRYYNIDEKICSFGGLRSNN
ncbi:hypothetical protein RvY_08072 [Ramazzottius varieornatus]|uniref:Uncharacterized protein n=1 Tax=Ramazzottius varieornatus TaxID=947166 RepID=A0A1D1V4G4_RAMVA|nr:hypothetical protein RvY_08072 [Ramazzottius varieornatus]